MFQTLSRRLILSHLLVALVSIALVYAFAGRTIFQSAIAQTEHRMEDLAFATSNALEEPLDKLYEGETSINAVQTVVAHWLADEEDLRYAVFLSDGTPVIDNEGDSLDDLAEGSNPEVYLALESKLGESDVIRVNSAGIEMIYVAVRIEHEEHILGVLRLGTPTQVAQTSATNSLITLLIFTALITPGVGIAGWAFARNLAKPIEHLTGVAHDFSGGDLNARANPSGPDELQRLAQTFNSMGSRLQENTGKLRDFVANASHELRTPLTAIKLRIEALQGGATDHPKTASVFLAEMESEVDRLTNMVNDLLDLSRIEAGLDDNAYDWTNLGELAAETCELFSVRARRAGVRLINQAAEDLPPLFANEHQLRRVLDNLVANALEYTPEGGEVRLRIYTAENGRNIRLTVSDTGAGIPPEHLARIFERFYRVPRPRPRSNQPRGTGLGLAIVKSIIEAHGGEISAASEMGKGTIFQITLPL